MKKFFSLSLTLFLIASIFFTGCSTTQSGELKTVKVSEVAHSVFYAPQYAAIANGFFEQEGITIDLVNGNGADKVMASILSGDIDIGFCGPEAPIYISQSEENDYPVIFAQVTKRDGSFIVGREEDEDFDFSALKGSYIIGGRKGGVPQMTLEYVLRKNGIDPNEDLTVDTAVQFPAMAGTFVGGLGDYVTLFEPAALEVESGGNGYVLASVGEESGEVPYTAYTARKSYIEENPETIQGFTNAVDKGLKWVNESSSEEVAEAIKDFFPDVTVEDLTKIVQRYKDIDAWMTHPAMTEDSFERLQDIMALAGELDKRVDFEMLVDNSFANNVK